VPKVLCSAFHREKDSQYVLEGVLTDTSERFVVGVTGSLGSGCTTLSKTLEKKGFKRVSISDAIKQKFRELNPGKEPTRQSFGPDWRAVLQDIGNKGRSGEFSKDGKTNTRSSHCDYWVKQTWDSLNNHAGDIVIDGIRNTEEVEYLRKVIPHGKFWLIAVYADVDTRWERLEAQGSYENRKVFVRDDQRDSREDNPAGQRVQRCVYSADYVFNNVQKIEPTHQICDAVWRRLRDHVSIMKGDSSRDPTKAEVFMATAVSQSHASRCIKRKVGALIVDEERNIPLSVGYNDNPIGMEACFSRYDGLCYKDKVMESKLESMGPLYCPECGFLHKRISPPWICGNKTPEEKQCRCNFKSKFFPSRNIELCTALHAEERAIRSLGSRSAEGCTIYVNTFPCFQCARYIKDADIKKVVYVEAYPIKEAVDFLKDNGIEIVPFEGFKPRVFNQVFKQVE
jgi:deoxycytidylate deaminase